MDDDKVRRLARGDRIWVWAWPGPGVGALQFAVVLYWRRAQSYPYGYDLFATKWFKRAGARWTQPTRLHFSHVKGRISSRVAPPAEPIPATIWERKPRRTMPRLPADER